jgi:outer membrane protein
MKAHPLTKVSRPFIMSGLAAALIVTGFVVNQAVNDSAEAQVTIPVILVINRAQLLNESEAGKNVAEQAETLRETIAGELKVDFDTLNKEQEELIAQQAVLAQDVLQQRVEKLRVKQQDFQIEQEIKNREYQASVAKATNEIGKVLEPILADIIRERSATMLIDKSMLIYSTPDIEVTAEAMKRLNEKLTQVAVERVKVERKDLEATGEVPPAQPAPAQTPVAPQ